MFRTIGRLLVASSIAITLTATPSYAQTPPSIFNDLPIYIVILLVVAVVIYFAVGGKITSKQNSSGAGRAYQSTDYAFLIRPDLLQKNNDPSLPKPNDQQIAAAGQEAHNQIDEWIEKMIGSRGNSVPDEAKILISEYIIAHSNNDQAKADKIYGIVRKRLTVALLQQRGFSGPDIPVD